MVSFLYIEKNISMGDRLHFFPVKPTANKAFSRFCVEPTEYLSSIAAIGQVISVETQLRLVKEIVGAIESQPGIASAVFTPGHPHLMLVDYDADALHAVDALRLVTDKRVYARLVS